MAKALLIFVSTWLLTLAVAQNSNPNVPMYQNDTIAAIRLFSGNSLMKTQGRVEIQSLNGVWGTICPKYWSSSDNTNNVYAICYMLGFKNGGSRIANSFGDGNKNFVMQNVSCPVNAKSLYECNQTFVKDATAQDEELAVSCNFDNNGSQWVNFTATYTASSVPITSTVNQMIVNSNCSSGSSTLRLVGGDDPSTKGIGNGYVQVLNNGAWSFVSAEDWDEADAIVLCRELCYTNNGGFTPLPGAVANSVPTQINPVISVQGFNCIGNESSVLNCPRVGAVPGSGSKPLAGVQCSPICTDHSTNISVPEVDCTNENIVAYFAYSNFRFTFTAADVLASNHFRSDCMKATSNSTGIIIQISLNSSCGTQMEEDDSYIRFMNTVKLMVTPGSVIVYDYIDNSYHLVCAIKKTYDVMERYQSYFAENFATITEEFRYTLSMDLYTNCNFTNMTPTAGSIYLVEVGSMLDAAITIDNYDSRTKLIIDSCEAFPTNPVSAFSSVHTLIKDRCPIDPTLTIYNLDNRRQGFQVKAFSFPGYSMVYLRCHVTICLLSSTRSECNRTCNSPTSGSGKRRKRSTNGMDIMVVNTKNILLLDSGLPAVQALKGTTTESTLNTTSAIKKPTTIPQKIQPIKAENANPKAETIQTSNSKETNMAVPMAEEQSDTSVDVEVGVHVNGSEQTLRISSTIIAFIVLISFAVCNILV